MKFKLTRVLNNIPVIYRDEVAAYSFGFINHKSGTPKEIPTMVSLVPLPELVIPVDSISGDSVGFYDRVSTNILTALDASNLEADSAEDLISKVAKFYTLPSGLLEPTQRAYFVTDKFKKAIAALFSEEIPSYIEALLADLPREDLESNL